MQDDEFDRGKVKARFDKNTEIDKAIKEAVKISSSVRDVMN